MEFGNARSIRAEPRAGFGGLTAGERRVLAGWIAAARPGGIETVEDLGLRPWPGQAADNVIGVFRSGHLLASWLIVGNDGSWVVASCRDSTVSPRVATLAEALTLISHSRRE